MVSPPHPHAARQLPDATNHGQEQPIRIMVRRLQDIEHDTPSVVAGGIYGEVVEINWAYMADVVVKPTSQRARGRRTWHTVGR